MSDTSPCTIDEETRQAFACEINNATQAFGPTDGTDERPGVILPTGAWARSLLFVGQVEKIDDISDRHPVWRGRMMGMTGPVYVSIAGDRSVSPRTLLDLSLPAIISIVGQPVPTEDENGTEYVLVRLESVSRVDKRTWRRWLAETADRTTERIESFGARDNEYAVKARDLYGSDIDRYREAVDRARTFLD